MSTTRTPASDVKGRVIETNATIRLRNALGKIISHINDYEIQEIDECLGVAVMEAAGLGGVDWEFERKSGYSRITIQAAKLVVDNPSKYVASEIVGAMEELVVVSEIDAKATTRFNLKRIEDFIEKLQGKSNATESNPDSKDSATLTTASMSTATPSKAPAAPVINPADPLSAIVVSAYQATQPHIDHAVQRAHTMTVSTVKPILDKLVTKLAEMGDSVNNVSAEVRRFSTATKAEPSVDKDEVEKIVTSKLRNGTGEEIRKSLATLAPAAFNDILSRAAAAVAATSDEEVVDESTAKLVASVVPIPDPHYCWTPAMETMAKLLDKARARDPQNAMLVGPSGCGKTAYAFEFAAKAGIPILTMDCANLREARDWFGIKGASNGKTYFRKSQFWLAVEGGNCVILLDEFNRAHDHVRNPLMPLLDHRRQSWVEDVGQTLKVGNGVVFFATLNEGMDYSGTHATDRAMSNRFPRRVELTYLPRENEIKVLLDRVTGLKKADAEKLVDIAGSIRSKSAASGNFGGNITGTVSTRQLIAAAQDFVDGGPGTFLYTIFSHFSADGGTSSERAQVIKMFEGKGYKL